MMQSSKQTETLSIKDAYTLYGSGKKRRYGLLFAVNGGAFVISETHQKLKSHHLCESKSRPYHAKIIGAPNDDN